TVAPKPGSGLATALKAAKSGPLKSAIGLSPSAVFSVAMRGEFLSLSSAPSDVSNALKSIPPVVPKLAVDALGEIVGEIAKAEVEAAAMSVSGDGTMVFAAAMKSTGGFELKVGELIDKLTPEIAKDAGENADKVKEMTKRDAVTLSGTKL